MSKTNDGGPAFPFPGVSVTGEEVERISGADGMPLRDWFAGQALAFGAGYTSAHAPADLIAKRCYQIADAMLKAREEP